MSSLKGEIDELRQEVKEYKPGEASTCPDRIQFPEHLHIGLFGRTGCGKTSLINSLKFAVTGRLRRAKWLQVATQEKAGGHTMYRKLANLTHSIFVIDNRGLDDPNTAQAVEELESQLDGRRGYGERVEWQEGGESVDDESTNLSDDDLDTGHKISCAVFVFSAQHDIETNTTGLTEIVDFLHAHQGRYPVAIITHVDVAEKKHVENLRTVLRVSGISDIFDVANITSDKPELEEAYQMNLLTLIERCMTDGDETLIFKHYQRRDLERKAEKERRRREKQQQEEAERRRREEEERRANEEKRKQMEYKRELDAHRRREKETVEREYQLRMEQERLKHEMEMERQRMAAEEKERDQREREREARYQQALQKAENDKQLELIRIMQANQQPERPGICKLM